MMKENLFTSRRARIAVIAAVVPVILQHGFGIVLSPEQLQQLTALAGVLIGALTFRDHTK